jgi:hypothetical protein
MLLFGLINIPLGTQKVLPPIRQLVRKTRGEYRSHRRKGIR